MNFKQDSPFLGLLIGVFVPFCVFYIQSYLIPILMGYSFSSASMELFALVLNLPFFRYYIMNLKYEKTAKGILFATFIYALIWVYVNHGGY
tara:strand:- start:1228 stop:1500 length:273 start_codon:yes stop_codon:yes gene_type:complete